MYYKPTRRSAESGAVPCAKHLFVVLYHKVKSDIVYLSQISCYTGDLSWTMFDLTLTFVSMSNLTSPLDSSDRVSYWWSIHLECLSGSDKLLEVNTMYFNVKGQSLL